MESVLCSVAMMCKNISYRFTEAAAGEEAEGFVAPLLSVINYGDPLSPTALIRYRMQNQHTPNPERLSRKNSERAGEKGERIHSCDRPSASPVEF